MHNIGIRVQNLINNVISESSGLKNDTQDIILKTTGSLLIDSDEKIIKLIVSNLLSNALKYSQENVIIDGSNSGSTSKDLTITNTNRFFIMFVLYFCGII